MGRGRTNYELKKEENKKRVDRGKNKLRSERKKKGKIKTKRRRKGMGEE